MDIIRKCNYISNSYYNKGLKLAQERNLTPAVVELKKSLEFNKTNTNARNLLGLIYYHIGEVADALVQWVISLNLQPANNPANNYLDEIQRQAGVLDRYDMAIQRFNQCLALTQGGSDDFAVIQLSKLTEHNRNYLRAWVLLGLLEMQRGNNAKAYKAFQNALRIDHGHPLALQCSDTLKALRAKEKKPKADIKDVFKSQKKSKAPNNVSGDKNSADENNDNIVIEPYRENTGLGTAANIIIGFLIGVATIFFIYLPTAKSNMAKSYNEQVINVSNSLDKANNEIKSLNRQIESIQKELDSVNSEKSDIDAVYMDKIGNYQRLMQAARKLDEGDLRECARLFVTVDSKQITDIDDGSGISVIEIYNSINTLMNDNGYLSLQQSGDRAFETEDYKTALDYYELSYGVRPVNPAPLYKQGKCYMMMGEKKKANEIFTQVIEEFPDNPVAELAKADRGY